ncbi:MAG: endonuclease/exonuclease/phosphatase family protein [Myxococcota bacterium]
MVARTSKEWFLWGFLLLGVAACGEGGGGAATGCDADASPAAPKRGGGLAGAQPDPADPAPADPAIHDVQGRAHRSPLEGAWAEGLEGVVTAVERHGFYVQAPRERWDADPSTSEGIFVYLPGGAAVRVGDAVAVDGRVKEYVPGGAASGNLPTTELVDASVRVRASDVPLPPAVLLGEAGRRPPGSVVDDDADGSVLRGGRFEPGSDAIDFYESLEGMRVRIEAPLVVGPATSLGRLPVVADGGRGAGPRTVAGGLRPVPGDSNPERILLADARGRRAIDVLREAATGDALGGAVEGVLGYRYGAFEVRVVDWPPLEGGGFRPEERTALVGDDRHLTVATLNVENLAPTDPSHVEAVAGVVARSLQSPDVVALQEVQDGNGTARGELSAAATYAALTEAVRRAGGAAYDALDVPPAAEDADGGQPGGNIRVALLYRPDRVGCREREGERVARLGEAPGGGLRLAANPARLAPEHPAWAGSRKPLVAELSFGDRRLFVVNVHFASKRGDAPLFGARQPPPTPSEAQRLAQATVVADFVRGLLERQPDARVVVVGDMNAGPASAPLEALRAAGLADLARVRPAEDRHTYVYRGNARPIDHLLGSPGLASAGVVQVDILHLHADQPRDIRPTDHDPVVARIPWE